MSSDISYGFVLALVESIQVPFYLDQFFTIAWSMKPELVWLLHERVGDILAHVFGSHVILN